jgi:hypothetical protein
MNNEKKIGRYQQKIRQGLVPHWYDKNSPRYKLGAKRHWSGNKSIDNAKLRNDEQLLKLAHEKI